MFGLLKPCAHSAAKYGVDPGQWQAHMCGLCLGLRDGHGQLARSATNTDAIVLSMLTEAQLEGRAERTTAGPCALRGMRRAQVATADSKGIMLASTASLLLGAAEIRDHVDDGDSPALTRRPMAKMSSRWADAARRQARLIGFDVEPLVAALDSQSDRERRAHLLSLDELTEPSRMCAAEFFAHSAVLADRPDNIAALREAGGHFGRIAHLADAIEDFDADRERGRFNPLAATGTGMPQAYELLHQSDSRLRAALASTDLADEPAVRWMLLDPLRALVRRIGGGVGVLAAHACSVPRQESEPRPGARAQRTRHRPPTRRPGIGEALTIVLGVYCTGYACCADHTSPCSGEQKEAWWKNNLGNCCDGAECCSNCGSCCGGGEGGGGCCDGCCCDGCGCDC
ncbi:DUF5685 family protein [Nocardia cyriacigeorgica]|uniref:DUF5685 family protein n=1 Tax=Nocardia cyriacigeorgica TaxID=135487 RepID=UPI001893C392|nr:DUF5685 family protein [Nocardia cyriacigeorgica]MBF6437582.1 regulator [Nocardia cyriacigeorgica]